MKSVGKGFREYQDAMRDAKQEVNAVKQELE